MRKLSCQRKVKINLVKRKIEIQMTFCDIGDSSYFCDKIVPFLLSPCSTPSFLWKTISCNSSERSLVFKISPHWRESGHVTEPLSPRLTQETSRLSWNSFLLLESKINFQRCVKMATRFGLKKLLLVKLRQLEHQKKNKDCCKLEALLKKDNSYKRCYKVKQQMPMRDNAS